MGAAHFVARVDGVNLLEGQEEQQAGDARADRVMAVNMIGTLTIIMVVVFVVHLGEAYLADIALIYAMISFLSVVVLCKVYTGIYRERKHEQELLGAKNDNPVETLVQSEKAGEQQ